MLGISSLLTVTNGPSGLRIQAGPGLLNRVPCVPESSFWQWPAFAAAAGMWGADGEAAVSPVRGQFLSKLSQSRG